MFLVVSAKIISTKKFVFQLESEYMFLSFTFLVIMNKNTKSY